MSSALGLLSGSAIQPSPRPTKTLAKRPPHAEKFWWLISHARLARNTTSGATSSGRIALKNPVSSSAFASPSVSVTILERPNGSTVLARMPCGSPSSAMTLVNPTSPAFLDSPPTIDER